MSQPFFTSKLVARAWVTGVFALSMVALGSVATSQAHAQTLYWIDSGDIVRYDVAGGADEVLVPGLAVETLSVDPDVDTLLWFQAPFSLQAAGIDGTGAMEIISYPFGFMDLEANRVDGRVYWINSFNGQLVSVQYDGSDPQVVGGMFFMSGIAIDPIEEKIYFHRDTPGVLQRMNFDGSNEETILLGLDLPRDARYDSVEGRVFWRNGAGAIERCQNDGSALTTVLAPGSIAGTITNLVVDEVQQRIYLSTDVGSVWSMNTDGEDLSEIYSSGINISELAIAPGGLVPMEQFIRGDINQDGGFDIGDPVTLLGSLFVPGTPPSMCQDAEDANDDGSIDLSDGIFLLSALFVAGSPTPTPAACGVDPTPADALDCASYPCP